MTYTEFSELFPDNQVFQGIADLKDENLMELVQTGSVAVELPDGSRRVFTLLIQVNESDIPAVDWSNAVLRRPR